MFKIKFWHLEGKSNKIYKVIKYHYSLTLITACTYEHNDIIADIKPQLQQITTTDCENINNKVWSP